MQISRREFLKYCSVAAGALGLTATDLLKLEEALALDGGLKVVWLNGQACTGCTVSLANSVYYATIQEILLFTQASDSVDLMFSETLSAGMDISGMQGIDPANLTGGFVLAVEGAIPNDPSSGTYCDIATTIPGTGLGGGVSIGAAVTYYAGLSSCAAILGIGTCASYGGIPAGEGNITHAKGLLSHLGSAFRSKIVNIPGCPPNPNWIVGTIAYVISKGLALPRLDSLRRPIAYYGQRNCNNCERFGKIFINNKTPDDIGDPAQTTRCLKYVGCKGSRTKSDCSIRKWHSPGYGQLGVNWCVGAGAPCQGCTQNFFPDRMSPFHYIK